MSKLIISFLTIASTFAGIFFFFPLDNQLPHEQRLQELIIKKRANNALLICSQIRISNVKNKWGSLIIDAHEGCVTVNHDLELTNITGTLVKSNPLMLQTDRASLRKKEHLLTLIGNIKIQQQPATFCADSANIALKSYRITATGNVHIRDDHRQISTDAATIDINNQTAMLNGHIETILRP
ncbi:hypothetical protein FJ364_04655 [Candidatus Dependentiae bacterium]|nr:hypothetical protein [Candidatus Dependentiae bacterium]